MRYHQVSENSSFLRRASVQISRTWPVHTDQRHSSFVLFGADLKSPVDTLQVLTITLQVTGKRNVYSCAPGCVLDCFSRRSEGKDLSGQSKTGCTPMIEILFGTMEFQFCLSTLDQSPRSKFFFYMAYISTECENSAGWILRGFQGTHGPPLFPHPRASYRS